MKSTIHPLSRRKFVKTSAIFAAGLPVASQFLLKKHKILSDPVLVKWLDGKAPQFSKGVTWGMPWAKGAIKKGTDFIVQDGTKNIPSQHWALAYWPDGSLKWTAHAIAANENLSETLQVLVGKSSSPKQVIQVQENKDTIIVSTGTITCEINKIGTTFINSILRDGKAVATDGKLVLQVQNKAENEVNDTLITEAFEGKIDKLTIEQNGEVRTVIKIEGKHNNGKDRSWLPFVLRLYFYAGSEAIRLMHTIIFDGDEQKDFINGLGIRFNVPLKASLYNRHVRFVGENKGVFGEAVQVLTGLRRDAGKSALDAQIAGKEILTSTFDPKFKQANLQYVPAWGDYTLYQPLPDAFDIQKRTKVGCGWIQSAYGKRSDGTAYLGTPSGGMAFGIRNFWQSHPAQIDIRNAHTDSGEVTLWLWSPKAPAMDLQFYHDGMGQDTYAKQLDGLDITYEDYEPGFGRPVGVARTSEMQIWALSATPSHEELANIAEQIQNPPVLTALPNYLERTGIFGSAFATPDLSSDKKVAIEKQLDFHFDFYKKQVEQQHWYGFWNYGDVMHSYDQYRHVWRYDIGGSAWDNSELSTDLWLWYYFLRTGKKDVFRMAEAMTRHTGEVDVHHLGPFSPLGSRHNVMHWGCSAKQLRISTAANRRFYYYLTADERVGDLMREQVEADKTLRTIIPGRKVGQNVAVLDPKGDFANISFGTDWGALASAWLTEWERTENPKMRDKLLNSMRTIAEQPHGFFTGGAVMELSTGKYQKESTLKISVSHLSAAFGLVEICAELIDLVDMPIFEKAWLQYCVLYNAPAAEQIAALGEKLEGINLQQGHSKLTAFAAKKMNNPVLAARAWTEFYEGAGGIKQPTQTTRHIEESKVLNPSDEVPSISTNSTAQWGLAAMQCLAFLGKDLK